MFIPFYQKNQWKSITYLYVKHKHKSNNIMSSDKVYLIQFIDVNCRSIQHLKHSLLIIYNTNLFLHKVFSAVKIINKIIILLCQ